MDSGPASTRRKSLCTNLLAREKCELHPIELAPIGINLGMSAVSPPVSFHRQRLLRHIAGRYRFRFRRSATPLA